MGELWLRFTFSNLCVSSAIALVAFAVHRRGRQPLLAHLLWLGVLLKLVTPPVFTIPIIPIAVASSAVDESSPGLEDPRGELAGLAPIPTARIDAGAERPSRRALGGIWLVGSLVTLVAALRRLGAFRRSLRLASHPAPAHVQRMCDQVGVSLGLRHAPEVITTDARITPFVWWLGGRVQIVLPREVQDSLSREGLRLLLAHELAHVRRRDHWVRWVEWLAGVAFWWNPVMWWSRRNLRVSEELACDALVLQSLVADRRTYADALLSAAELLAGPALRPPALASPVHSGGSLEQRLTMILSDKLPRTPRWLRTTVLALTAGLLPLSLAYAQDYGAVERRLGEAVAAGELTLAQAQTMMEALRKAAGKKPAAIDPRKKDHLAAEKKIRAAVAGGQLSPEEAEKKLAELREKMSPKDADQDGPRRRYEEGQRRIEIGVKNGTLSEEDAEKRLAQMRIGLFGSPEKDADMEDRRRRYEQAQRRVEVGVKSGRISKEDGEKRLVEMRIGLFGDPEKKSDMEARRRRYEQAQRRVEVGVKSGRISKEDGKKRLIELRKQLFGDPEKDADMDARRKRYEEGQRRIEIGVKDGTLSKEDAEKRLIEMRKALFGDPEKKDADMDASRRR